MFQTMMDIKNMGTYQKNEKKGLGPKFCVCDRSFIMTSKIIQKMTIMPTLKLGMGEYLPNVKVVDRYTQMSPQSYS